MDLVLAPRQIIAGSNELHAGVCHHPTIRESWVKRISKGHAKISSHASAPPGYLDRRMGNPGTAMKIEMATGGMYFLVGG
jgi:hypothetical protein